MLCNTQPYNENEDVLISKTDCYNYILTNKSICTQTVTVQLLTADTVQPITTYTLEPLSTLNITLPSDGIYSIKGVGGCNYLTVEDEQEFTFDVMHVAVFDLGLLSGTQSVTFVRDTVAPVTVYDSGVHGASTLNTPANLLAQLLAYGTATGKPFLYSVLAPTDPIGGGWDELYANIDNWRIIVGYIGTEVNEVTVGGVNYAPAVRACVYYDPGVPGTYQYVTQTTVNGDALMTPPQYIDLAVNEQFDLWRSWVAGEMGAYGNIFDAGGPDEVAAVILNEDEECPVLVVTLAEGTEELHPIQWCTTLFEWCALWNCLQKKMAEWLCCNDPCAPKCNPPHGEEWIDQVMNLTMWGIAPLLTEHHLWQFGKMSDDYGSNLVRLQPTLLLWSRWYKLVQGCGCPQANGCSPCSGGGLLIPQSPIIQPVGTSTGGCGCG